MAPTVISMTIEGKKTLGAQPKIIDSQHRTINEFITTPIYKKAQINEKGNELVVSFEGNCKWIKPGKVVWDWWNNWNVCRFELP